MKHALPSRPNLDHLKKQAKDLLDAARGGQSEALARFAGHHPAYREGGHPPRPAPALHDAQLVLAREYGFPSWPRLREEVERLTLAFGERAKRFVSDALSHPERARRALALEPALAGADLWARLVMGDAEGLGIVLRRDPGAAARPGGPREGWQPIHYVAFSRLPETAGEKERCAECARLLLDAGADAGAAWVDPRWGGSPLRLLYGATGVNDNPALARLLLERGAPVDDGESVIHAAEHFHEGSLAVLREFQASLGKDPLWKNTPLQFVLASRGPASGGWSAAAKGIDWLLAHGSDPNIPCGEEGERALHAALKAGHPPETFEKLLAHGADPNLANAKGTTPLAAALRAGRGDIAELLRARGATEPELSGPDRLAAAIFAGEGAECEAVRRAFPGADGELREADPFALVRAATGGNVAAIGLLLDAGWEIGFKGEKEWGHTPLHAAAWNGWAEAVELLLARGADPEVRANPPEAGPVLGWAAHGSGYQRNPRGDYPRLVRALIAAGARVEPVWAEMASPEVAEVIHAAALGVEGKA